MTLDFDVGLFTSSTLAEDDVAQFSEGTRKVRPEEKGAAYFEQGSILPRSPWTLIPPPTGRSPQKDRKTDKGNTILVLDFRDRLGPSWLDLVRSGDPSGIDYLRSLLPPLYESERGLEYLGSKENIGNLPTVTVNRSLNRFIGLHVDTWDGDSFESRTASRNRICFNVGERDRYFLFMPVTVKTIYEVARAADWYEPSFQQRPTLMARQFMTRHPELPAIRCRLAPGQAYVAPTENLIHDGSTLGGSGPDRSVTFLGHFTVDSEADLSPISIAR